MKKCLQCGKDFKPNNGKQKFCSDACKLKNARKMKKQNKVETIAPSRETKVTDLPAPAKLEIVYDDPKKRVPLDDQPINFAGLTKQQLEIRKKKLGF